MKIILRDLTSCSSVEVHRRFDGTSSAEQAESWVSQSAIAGIITFLRNVGDLSDYRMLHTKRWYDLNGIAVGLVVTNIYEDTEYWWMQRTALWTVENVHELLQQNRESYSDLRISLRSGYFLPATAMLNVVQFYKAHKFDVSGRETKFSWPIGLIRTKETKQMDIMLYFQSCYI